jgi:hypothetical protein
MQAVCFQPRSTDNSRYYEALSRAAPFIFGTMLGVQGTGFREEHQVDLKQLFGIDGEMDQSSSDPDLT